MNPNEDQLRTANGRPGSNRACADWTRARRLGIEPRQRSSAISGRARCGLANPSISAALIFSISAGCAFRPKAWCDIPVSSSCG